MSRVLIVEDEAGTRMLFESRLRDAGHEVSTVQTGALGLVRAREGNFDLFLVDINLGAGIDGYEVCRRLKAIPQTHSVPVVLISGQSGTREELHKGYAAGCQAFLLKGDLTLLEDVVQAMLRLKRLQDDLALHNRLLEEQNRRLAAEKRRGADLESALRDTGNHALVFRDLAAGKPDGVLIANEDGVVRAADRGASELLGQGLEGRNLGSLAPASGLEAQTRDAHTEGREGLRFDLPARPGRPARSLIASVIPLVPQLGSGAAPLRIVMLLDAGKRRVAADLLRLQEQGLPRPELGPLLEAAREVWNLNAIRGQASNVQALRAAVRLALGNEQPVLLQGDAGSGRQTLARVLHFSSLRSGFFVPVLCGALAPELLEAELFGHAKDAFAGAWADRPGLVQQAHSGTLYLHEISALPLAVQARIATLVQKGEALRVGATRPEPVETRVIASTSISLEAEAAAGRFSAELLELLSGQVLYPPALSEHSDDIAEIALEILGLYEEQCQLQGLSAAALAALEAYAWPGNLRELHAVLERAAYQAHGRQIEVEDLTPALRETAQQIQKRDLLRVAGRPASKAAGTHQAASQATAPRALPGEREEPPLTFDDYERLCIRRALTATHGDRIKAARLLQVGKSTLYRKLKKLGID